jgi:hypothetical protein
MGKRNPRHSLEAEKGKEEETLEHLLTVVAMTHYTREVKSICPRAHSCGSRLYC